ncbi:caspase, EACC1-associated type [Sorangium atrum]|uniref:Caspase family protein n=1 Tax=Sorangium atrum TaxID=2995308 RepID=A0ABT5C7P2_9BACT|nr:caspase family protein [Sorangium aterium]MDC0682377.1 caspase family protein [Sorangium aterium]
MTALDRDLLLGGRDRIALIIANGMYADGRLRSLQAPALDASKLADTLESPDIGDFRVQLCVDGSQLEVRKAIGALFHRRHPEDLLVLYYSGHGLKDDWGHLHLAARDTEKELFSATSVDAAWISRQIDQCPAKRIVLILDCCYSGAYENSAKSEQDSVDIAGTFMGDGSGRVVISATTSVQLAWQADQPVGVPSQSIFTRHLVEGLSTGTADLDRDGYVDVHELCEYVQASIKAEGGRQTPQMWTQKYEGRLRIAKAPLRPTIPASGGNAAITYELFVCNGPLEGRRFVLHPGEFRVGREPDCFIRLDDPKVSRKHATIVVGADEVRVIDQGSTHGTKIDDQRITSALLPQNGQIIVGGTVLRLVRLEAAGARQTAETVAHPPTAPKKRSATLFTP